MKALALRLLRKFSTEKPILGECFEQLGPLLIRYKVIDSKRFGGVFVHHLRRSDIERDNHDHPWAFVAFLFGGGYIEHTPEGQFKRRRFSLLYRPATFIHRVEIKEPVWTLVFVGPTKREWGFWTRTGWVSWKLYKYFDEC